MLSTFEFFEPDIAAVAVALAAVCGHVRIKRKREKEKEKRISIFEKESDLRKREVCDWKEGRKEGNEVREGQEVRWTWMDGWIWVDGHMGEHFRGTGGR